MSDVPPPVLPSSIDFEKLRNALKRWREIADNPPPSVPPEVLKRARDRLSFMEAILILYSVK